MSTLVSDGNNRAVQCMRLPYSGVTGAITTVAGASASSPALVAGIYRIISSVNISIASGTATANDLQLRANAAEYFYINSGATISAFNTGAGGGTVSYTLMP